MTVSVDEAKEARKVDRTKQAIGMMRAALRDLPEGQEEVFLAKLRQELGLVPVSQEADESGMSADDRVAPAPTGAFSQELQRCDVEIAKCDREILRADAPAHWYARREELVRFKNLVKRAETIPSTQRRFVCRHGSPTLHMYEMRQPIKFRRRMYTTDDPLELARLEEVMEQRPGYIKEYPPDHVALLTIDGDWDGVYPAEEAQDRIKRRGISRMPH